jgi:hypothetical protein
MNYRLLPVKKVAKPVWSFSLIGLRKIDSYLGGSHNRLRLISNRRVRRIKFLLLCSKNSQ